MAPERDELPENAVEDAVGLEQSESDPGDFAGDHATEESSDRATETLRELVTYLVHNLVDDPETVEILVERRGSLVHIQLRLPEGEMGKMIGRGGRIAKAIRTVLLIAGSKHHLRVSLDIES